MKRRRKRKMCAGVIYLTPMTQHPVTHSLSLSLAWLCGWQFQILHDSINYRGHIKFKGREREAGVSYLTLMTKLPVSHPRSSHQGHREVGVSYSTLMAKHPVNHNGQRERKRERERERERESSDYRLWNGVRPSLSGSSPYIFKTIRLGPKATKIINIGSHSDTL